MVKPQLSVLLRCDGSPSLGLGHVMRCVALADALRRNHDVPATFAMRSSAVAADIVRRHGHDVLLSPAAAVFDYTQWLAECMRQALARILFVDVRDDLGRVTLDALAGGAVIATLEDLTERRWAADFAFYPPVPQVRRVDWTGFQGRLCAGWEWVILRNQFSVPFAPRRASQLSLLIAMGGSDPAGLTLKAVRAANRLDEFCRQQTMQHADEQSSAGVIENFESVIIIGASFCHAQALRDLLRQSRRTFTVREDVSDMAAAMAETDLAICSFGMTAYELAAVGVPAIYVCLTADHAESASALVDAGMGVSVGVDDAGTEVRLTNSLMKLLLDRSTRSRMSASAREHIDGRGADRVARLLVDAACLRT